MNFPFDFDEIASIKGEKDVDIPENSQKIPLPMQQDRTNSFPNIDSNVENYIIIPHNSL